MCLTSDAPPAAARLAHAGIRRGTFMTCDAPVGSARELRQEFYEFAAATDFADRERRVEITADRKRLDELSAERQRCSIACRELQVQIHNARRPRTTTFALLQSWQSFSADHPIRRQPENCGFSSCISPRTLIGAATINGTVTALRFFFTVTLDRVDVIKHRGRRNPTDRGSK